MRQHVFLCRRILFVTYYVVSGRLVNWIGCTPSDGWREESWSARGDRDEALRAGWHAQVRALVAGTEPLFRWAMFARPPLERWIAAGPAGSSGGLLGALPSVLSDRCGRRLGLSDR